MASTYSALLNLELIGSGEQSNAWGNTTNNNLQYGLEYSIAGVYTAFPGDKIFVNTSSGAVTITLPGSPAVGDEVRFVDLASSFDTHNLTVARNGNKINNATSDLTVATEDAAFALVYSGATYGWKITEK